VESISIDKIIMKNILKYSLIALLSSSTLLLSSCLKDDPKFAAGEPNETASLYVLRNVFKGSDIQLNTALLSGAKQVAGVVVSQVDNKNLPEGIIALENNWRGQVRGIYMQVSDPSKFQLGDSLTIGVEGASLTNKEGFLMLKGVAEDKITRVSQANKKTYRDISIANLIKNYAHFEGTLIRISAEVEPEPAAGTALSGAHILADAEKNSLTLYTNAQSPFAQLNVAPSATFQGLPIQISNDLQLRMQQAEDMNNASGKLYMGWPETFEEPYQAKTSYNTPATDNLVELSTGTWQLFQSIQGNTVGRDRIVSGKQAIRFQQNLSVPAYLQMNFDMPKGASKVTFWYGSYWTDRSCSFMLESSIDQGKTWVKVGETITDAHTTNQSVNAKQATFLMNIQVPVRFRITKLGLGTSSDKVSNGRLGVDDFAVFQSY